MPLREAMKQHCLERGSKPAVEISGRSVNYRPLIERANLLDAFIAACPRVPRDQDELRDIPVFGLLMGNHSQVAEFLVAALAGTSCVILLDPMLPEEELCNMLDQLPPDILFTAERSDRPFQGRGFPVKRIENDADMQELLSHTPGALQKRSNASDPFLVAFTSGTTSRPKAFLRRRGTWRASLSAGHAHFNMHSKLHTLSPGPLTHGLSLYAFAETLDAGATFYSPGKFCVEKAWSTIADHQIARLVCVPSVLDVLNRHAQDDRTPLNTLRQITTAGAKLEDSLLSCLKNVAPLAQVTEYYGASELGFVTTITHQPSERGYISDASGVGRAFPGVEIKVKAFDAVPSDTNTGAVWVHSGLVIDGYLWQDDQVGFQRDGEWATVGDIGRLDGSGNLELIGRESGMVISGGNNIYPDEIVSCLRRHPLVKEACVVGISDTYLGKALVAVLQFETDGEGLTVDELVRHCAENLQKYKIPRRFLVANAWPMTISGKISTGQIMEWIMQGDDRLVPV